MKRFKINNVEEAVELFEEIFIKWGEADEACDSKTCNKLLPRGLKCITFLYEKQQLARLYKYLSHDNPHVRYMTAFALLPLYEDISLKVLQEIKDGDYGFASLGAITILTSWKEGNIVYPYQTEKQKKSKTATPKTEDKSSEGSNNAGGTEITEDLSQDISRLSSIFKCPQDDDKQSGYSVFIDTERQEIIVHVNTFVNPYSQDIETVYQRWVKRFRAFEHVATVSPYKPSKLGFMQIVLSIPLDKGTDEVLTQLYEVIQSICNEWKPNERKVCFKADYKGAVCYFEGAWWYPYRAIIKDGGKYKRYDFSDEMKFDEKMWDIVKDDYDDLENTESFALIDAKEFEDIWKKTSFFHKIIPW